MGELVRLSRYILDWYVSNPFYIFFKIVDAATPDSFFNTAFRNSICDTFVNDCMLFLRNTGTPIQFITPVPTSVGALVTGSNKPVLLDPSNPHDKARIIRFYKLLYGIMNALTPALKVEASTTRTSTRHRMPGGPVFESPEIIRRAIANALAAVHSNEGHVVLYTYIPGTVNLGYFLLKLQDPYIYADYITYTPLARTLVAFDTDSNIVPEPY
jgi:hypothetical protein